MKKTVCVIPARYASQRFPRKMLHPLLGKPLIHWTIEAARRIPVVDEILVATDHEEIRAVAAATGVDVVMTDPELPSGTDRVNAALQGRDGDIIVNLQGDEPMMPREAVVLAHAEMLDKGTDVATACVPLHDQKSFEAPHVVKVVRARDNRALYFSRSPIPSHARQSSEEIRQSGYIFGFKHLGLYIYRREALSQFCALSPSSLETTEKLEQLRMLENGLQITCITSPRDSVGIDVPEDVAHAEELLRFELA